METHAAQDVKMVLMHAGQYPLADGGECAFVVGQKDCLNEPGKMHPTKISSFDWSGWDSCERKEWCNNDYKNALPSPFVNIFRQINDSTGRTKGDYFALAAEKEILGFNKYSTDNEAGLFQFNWYENFSHVRKNVGSYGEYRYWNRSPSSYLSVFCCIASNGGADYGDVDNQYPLGISPFGCIGKKVTA